jgi:LysM repeat protein
MSRNILTIRILLPLMIVAMSLSGTTVFAQSGTTVRVDPLSVSAQINDNVNLSIKVDNVANLTAIESHLSFNPSVLEVLQVTNGGFIAADFPVQNTFDNAAGTIDYAVAQMNRPAAQGSGALINIVFRAKANGVSTVALRPTQSAPSGLLLSDANGIAIQTSWINGSVNVGSSVTPVTPTPVTPTPVTPTSTTPTPVTPTSVTPTSVTPKPITPTPVTPTVNPTTTPLVGSVLGTHGVRWGETLYCIGRAYGVAPYAIASANGLWWPYIIYPSQVLTIPNIAWSPIPAGPICQRQFSAPNPPVNPSTPVPTAITVVPTTVPATPLPPSAGCRYNYIVVPEDNLYRIGLRYGVSYTEIARVNNIANPRVIYSGQQLCIP